MLAFKQMRTTLLLKDNLLEKARQATGIRGTAALVRAGLQELVQCAASQRLIALGGTLPDLKVVPRRRSARNQVR